MLTQNVGCEGESGILSCLQVLGTGNTLMQGVGLRELLSMTDMFPDQTGYTWQVRLIRMKLLTNFPPGSA